MAFDLEGWCEGVLPSVRSISPFAARRYSAAENLAHYRQVARLLQEKVGDPSLSRAGFLHGLRTDVLRDAGIADGEVLEILESREQVASLAGGESDVSAHLRAHVLPSVREIRGIILFVLEELDHLDPGGELAAWTARFHSTPSPPPPSLPRQPAYGDRFADTRHHLEFVANVLLPTAEHFGFWAERNLADDAVLWYRAPDQLRAIAQWCAEPATLRAVCAQVNAVREALTDLPAVKVEWEWRHAASIHRKVEREGSLPAELEPYLNRCGFVTAVCPDVASCYQALGAIHAAMSYEMAGVRDRLNFPSTGGFRALSTVVWKRGVARPDHPTPVRILPADSAALRSRPLESGHPGPLPALPEGAKSDLLVFAPDGRAIRLPHGATVLNFAAAIHTSFVVLARGARVNQRQVDLFHPLRERDVVWLELNAIALPLPTGWRDRVPERKKIQRAYNYSYAAALVAGGRRWLRERLVTAGLGEASDKELEELLVHADARLLQGPARPLNRAMTPVWWLYQLGRLDAENHSEDVPGRIRINPRVAQRLLTEMVKLAERERIIRERGLQIARGAELTVEICPRCNPSSDEPYVGDLKDEKLVLHRSGAPCAEGYDAEQWKRSYPRAQYFVATGTPRAGLTMSLLGVFHQAGVGISEVAAIRHVKGEALVRIRVDPIGGETVKRLTAALERIHGIHSVRGPDDPVTENERVYLSERWEGALPETVLVPPYVCGQPVVREKLFYGRTFELAALEDFVAGAQQPDQRMGLHAFVTGPKKVGKSSLVFAFFRRLRTEGSGRFVTAYLTATGRSWSEYEPELARTLAGAAREHAAAVGGYLPSSLETLQLEPLIETIRDRLGVTVVLAVDEAVGLMRDTQRYVQETRRLIRFRGFVDRTPGVVVLWVGPKAYARDLGELGAILQAAREVEVEPLAFDDARRMLAAEKHRLTQKIEVSRPCARAVYELTGGNAFWIAHLGRRMWIDGGGTKKRVLRFTRPSVQKASVAVAKEALVFHDRYRFPPDPFDRPDQPARDALMRRLLREFATRDSAAFSPTAATLAETLDAAGTPATAREVSDVLQHLEEVGTVIGERTIRDAALRWRISAPLLAEHLRGLSKSGVL